MGGGGKPARPETYSTVLPDTFSARRTVWLAFPGTSANVKPSSALGDVRSSLGRDRLDGVPTLLAGVAGAAMIGERRKSGGSEIESIRYEIMT